MSDYQKDLVNGFWKYKEENFTDDTIFDPPGAHSSNSPPVFCHNAASQNVLIKPGLKDDSKQEFLGQIPNHRHKWFGSMRSSQALSQSVFGNLKYHKKLECLAKIKGDDGKPVFIRNSNDDENLSLEYPVDYLGERRSTSLDVFFNGNHRVSVECKLSERDVGQCSMVKIHCNGNYLKQCGRTERCYLSYRGVLYWHYIPQLFINWEADRDHKPCPLRGTYQLVRNILAACVQPDGKLDTSNGHAVLLYDERNPAFQTGGKGWKALNDVRAALKYPSLLQACTWQRVIDAMRSDSELEWLVDLLSKKYGL